MHKLTFTLKQHTPIIHFQHEQDGATLRVTEVKPKLDRFIIEKEGGIEKCRNKYPDWFISESHDALDYKMRILPIEPTKNAIGKGDRHMPMFFGNMGDDYAVNLKGTSIFENDVILEILNVNERLNGKIENSFPAFLGTTNFGTRQSKGYGCFWMNDGEYDNVFPKYYFTIARNDSWIEVLRRTELFYKAIRSGIQVVNKQGETTYYFKSLLFHYFHSKGLKWDKRLIKQGLLPELITPQKKKWNGKEESFDAVTPYKPAEYLVRDMLGLATSQEWRSYKTKIEKAFIKTNPVSKEGITRYKSPVYFKPYYDVEDKTWRIYFDFNEIPGEFHNVAFRVSGNKKSIKLTTPPDTVFTMQKYFDFLFREYSYEDYKVDIQSAEYPVDTITIFLQEAFDEVRTNLK